MMMARLRCSQHWAASHTLWAFAVSQMPANTARATSSLESEPIFCPQISLEEQPTTSTSPSSSFAAAMISSAACAAWFFSSSYIVYHLNNSSAFASAASSVPGSHQASNLSFTMPRVQKSSAP